jgi:hypothetical protein
MSLREVEREEKEINWSMDRLKKNTFVLNCKSSCSGYLFIFIICFCFLNHFFVVCGSYFISLVEQQA